MLDEYLMKEAAALDSQIDQKKVAAALDEMDDEELLSLYRELFPEQQKVAVRKGTLTGVNAPLANERFLARPQKQSFMPPVKPTVTTKNIPINDVKNKVGSALEAKIKARLKTI